MKKQALVLSGLGLLLFLIACTPPRETGPSTPAPPPQTGVLPKAAEGEGQARWANLLTEAKKEGTVLLYTIWGAETRLPLARAFSDKYGIDLQLLAFSRGPEITARAVTEKRAGLNSADVFGVGPITLLATMKPEGLLGPIEPLLVLPEVRDPRSWRGGQLPLLDKEGTALGMASALTSRILRNTDMVKEGEITSYMDVLRPQYKGKIALDDPTTTGAGVSVFAHMAMQLWDLEKSKEFLRDLVVKQEVAIVRERRTMVEWIARGKYALGIGALPEIVVEFIDVGSPIALVVIKEGIPLSTVGMSLAVPPVTAHPKATTVFVNWLLTKEGQEVFVKGSRQPSARVDVSSGGIHPVLFPQPGEKTYPETEELILFRGKMVDIAKEVIAAYSK